MSTLPHYALFGSLIAAAIGVLILSIATISHGLRRREESDPARGQRLRMADAGALLCFAVAAGFGAVGLMQQIRAVPPALAAPDDGPLMERLQALEKRLASAELELQARSGGSEERLAKLEGQVNAMEQRVVAVARDESRRVSPPPALRKAEAPPVRPKAAVAVPGPMSASPRLPPAGVTPDGPAPPPVSTPAVAPAPPASRETSSPRVDPQARVEPPARTEPSVRVDPPVRTESPVRTEPPARMESPTRLESPTRTEPPTRLESPTRTEPPARTDSPARVEPPRASVEPPARVEPRAVVEPPARAERPAEDQSLAAKLSRDWDEIKRHARRGGDELREGWGQLKRLFGN